MVRWNIKGANAERMVRGIGSDVDVGPEEEKGERGRRRMEEREGELENKFWNIFNQINIVKAAYNYRHGLSIKGAKIHKKEINT